MSDSLNSFDSLLQDVLKKKPPISASTTAELTKQAGNQPAENVSLVAARIENFLATCPRPYRLSGLYLIDSICKTKSAVRQTYVDAFSHNLAANVAIVLREASDKEEVSVQKVARIWVEKHLFNSNTLSLVSHTLKTLLNYQIPGSESLPVPVFPPQESHSPSPIATAGGSWQYSGPYSPPTGMSSPPMGANYSAPPSTSGYPPVGAPLLPPAMLPPSVNLTDDLSKLGDLNALLGTVPSVPTSMPQRPQEFEHRGPGSERRYPGEQRYPRNDGMFGPDGRYSENRMNGGDRYDHGNSNRSHPPRDYSDSWPNGSMQTRDDQVRQEGPFGAHFPQQRPGRQMRDGPGDEGEGASPAGPLAGPTYSSTLFVGSLNTNTSEQDIRDLFGPFGRIKKVTLKGDRGIAFVNFYRRVDAEMAKSSQDGANFGGRTLRIRWAKSDQSHQGGFDPETGLMFDLNDPNAPSPAHSAQTSSSSSSRYQSHQHGIPRGLKPIIGSSFADDDVSSPPGPSSNSNVYQRQSNYSPDADDYNNRGGKRRFEGDQPTSEKRRFDESAPHDGFQTMTSWSGGGA